MLNFKLKNHVWHPYKRDSLFSNPIAKSLKRVCNQKRCKWWRRLRLTYMLPGLNQHKSCWLVIKSRPALKNLYDRDYRVRL